MVKKRILNWFNQLPKDNEFADIVDRIVEEMRREFKLLSSLFTKSSETSSKDTK